MALQPAVLLELWMKAWRASFQISPAVRPPTQRRPTLRRRQTSEIYEWNAPLLSSERRGWGLTLYACLQSMNGALEKTTLARPAGDRCAVTPRELNTPPCRRRSDIHVRAGVTGRRERSCILPVSQCRQGWPTARPAVTGDTRYI